MIHIDISLATPRSKAENIGDSSELEGFLGELTWICDRQGQFVAADGCQTCRYSPFIAPPLPTTLAQALHQFDAMGTAV